MMRRTIKSYVLRAGRLSERQAQGLERALHHYELKADSGVLDFAQIFGRQAPVTLEIGFGMGASLFEMAKHAPDRDFIGIEVHRAGVGALASLLDEHQLTNVRIIMHDAVAVLNDQVPDGSLDGIQIYFPDPWPKKRHHKRRLIQLPLIDLLVKKLKTGGFIHTATDWEDYAVQMLEVLSAHEGLENQSPTQTYYPRPEHRPLTKFEQRGMKLGHGVWDLYFTKKG